MTSFSYDGPPPLEYICSQCGANGVRLYRQYNTFAGYLKLKCRACACQDQQTKPLSKSEHCIGFLVAAVPTEEGDTFWGYTSVPDRGVVWWDKLPKYVALAQ
jgi:hypothetical protein